MENSSKYAEFDFNVVSSPAGPRMNLTLNLTKQIDQLIFHNDLSVMSLDSPPNTKYRNMIKKSLDVCKFISDPSYNPILYPMWQEVVHDKRHKLLRKCPFKPVSS